VLPSCQCVGRVNGTRPFPLPESGVRAATVRSANYDPRTEQHALAC